MRQEMAFYQLMIENCSEEVLAKYGLNKDMKVTHWGWYYPAANHHITVEEVKKRSMTSVKLNIAKLIKAYEIKEFTPSSFTKCVPSVHILVFVLRHKKIHGVDKMNT